MGRIATDSRARKAIPDEASHARGYAREYTSLGMAYTKINRKRKKIILAPRKGSKLWMVREVNKVTIALAASNGLSRGTTHDAAAYSPFDKCCCQCQSSSASDSLSYGLRVDVAFVGGACDVPCKWVVWKRVQNIVGFVHDGENFTGEEAAWLVR